MKQRRDNGKDGNKSILKIQVTTDSVISVVQWSFKTQLKSNLSSTAIKNIEKTLKGCFVLSYSKQEKKKKVLGWVTS